MKVHKFIQSLKYTHQGLFNPWFHRDLKHDLSPESPQIRQRQLEAYLSERINRARFLLIAEALGYQGGHFTGIAMTSERILLGYQKEKYDIKPEHVFKGIKPERTSRPALIERGMSEPTATIVWGAFIEMGIDPYDVVLWNAVPWHPYKPEKGLLSNRTPLKSELETGLKHLKVITGMFKNAKVVAVGRKCETSLSLLDIDYTGVRHPANGGAGKFREQIKRLMIHSILD